MTNRAQTDIWRRPHSALVGLNVDEAPIALGPDREVEPGDIFRDSRGRMIVVLGVGECQCPCVIFDGQGDLMTVDRWGKHRLERLVRAGRMKEMPRWEAIWGEDT